ncbi:MAG: SDR family NAD(P)-dependent oxidoreductase [Sphingomonadales bacterium]|nr:SDR family NAD(P)-dependent oxidoreductase [Sphingomonadales bacterium]
MTFAQRYGPWAVIAGGSQGTGSALARRIAAQGVSLVLVAHDDALAETAVAIRQDYHVEVVTARIDLTQPDAAAQVLAAVGDREVGLTIHNAGADWLGERFLDAPLEDWLRLNRLNVDTMLACVHAFAAPMRARGRGGILLVNSGACHGGNPGLAIYSAAKAFQLNFAESLWSELRPHGVDVLTIVLGRTDTPGYHARRALRGIDSAADRLTPADAVAEQALARLPHGPVTEVGLADDAAAYGPLSAAQRRAKVLKLER